MSIKKQNIQNYYLYDTEVENLFISEYMPSAPENAVKLYLLALMHLGSGMQLTPDLAARKLGISLSQVDDAWTYWQKIGIARRTVRDPGRPQEYEIELLNIREMMYGRRPDAAPAAQEAPIALDDEAFSKLLRDIESTTGRLLEAREPEEVASWIARLRHTDDTTVRDVASWRLVILGAFSTLLVSLYLLFPAAFPHPHGRPPYLGLAMLAIPILLAAVQWCRAVRDSGFTQSR